MHGTSEAGNVHSAFGLEELSRGRSFTSWALALGPSDLDRRFADLGTSRVAPVEMLARAWTGQGEQTVEQLET